jgi:hypothetical protein
MKHTFSSLAALALVLSTSAVASPEPQLLVPTILDTVECIALDVISELLIGDPLAIAYCEIVAPPTKSVIKTRTTTIVRPTTVATVTITDSNFNRPTITSRTIMQVHNVISHTHLSDHEIAEQPLPAFARLTPSQRPLSGTISLSSQFPLALLSFLRQTSTRHARALVSRIQPPQSPELQPYTLKLPKPQLSVPLLSWTRLLRLPQLPELVQRGPALHQLFAVTRESTLHTTTRLLAASSQISTPKRTRSVGIY